MWRFLWCAAVQEQELGILVVVAALHGNWQLASPAWLGPCSPAWQLAALKPKKFLVYRTQLRTMHLHDRNPKLWFKEKECCERENIIKWWLPHPRLRFIFLTKFSFFKDGFTNTSGATWGRYLEPMLGSVCSWQCFVYHRILSSFKA